MTERIDPIDYLLAELDAEGLAEAERLIADDPAFRAEVERLRPMVGALNDLPATVWEAPEPPPLRHPRATARPSIFARLLQPVRIPAPALGFAAALVLLAGVVAGATLFDGASGAGPDGGQALALAAIGEGGALGQARVTDGGTRLDVSVEGLVANSGNEVYEVWLLTGPDKLLSLGSFRVGETGTGSVAVPLPVEIDSFELIDISREPVDGDPSHSSDSVLRGPTVA